MKKWHTEEDEDGYCLVIQDDDGDLGIYFNVHKSDADDIRDAHNASIAAANARIAELTATLDRLREVVPNEPADDWCSVCNKFVRAKHLLEGGDFCSHCNGLIWESPADVLRAILYPEEQGNG